MKEIEYNRDLPIRNFISVLEDTPDQDQVVWVKNSSFDIKPIRAYYLDGAFWPLDFPFVHPLSVTHYSIIDGCKHARITLKQMTELVDEYFNPEESDSTVPVMP